MNRLLHFLVFAAGLAAVCWIGAGYAGSHALALSVTALIAAVYLAGAWELHRSGRAARGLRQALAGLSEPPADLDAWLSRLQPGLRNAVRLRIEGARVALPGPALTPYFVGLLVLLGMLGTFLGMVATLRGTGLALESATDLQAIRASLAAPVQGLGFAFGTSIAGVAASAMLGLLAAMHRSELAALARELDVRIRTALHPYSHTYQREESFRLMQRQAELLPAMVERMQSMAESMERHTQSLNEQLLAGQARLHEAGESGHVRLAGALERSVAAGVAAGAQALNAAVQPAVEATMAGLAREADALHGALSQAMRRQLEEMSARFEAAARAAAQDWRGAWQEAVAGQQAANQSMSAALRQALDAALSRQEQAWNRSRGELLQTLAAQDERRLQAWTTVLGDTAAEAQAQAGKTVARIEQLLDAAAQAPRAAAEAVVEARRVLSASAARDDAMLEERKRMLTDLHALLDAVGQASCGQREAVDALLSRSADALERASAQFTQRMEAETGRMAGAAASLAGAGTEVAALGESLGGALRQFSESNAALTERLAGIEAALDKSMARSDEQLAYYVAQAREVVDLSILSQKQIIEELQALAERRAPAASGAA